MSSVTSDEQNRRPLGSGLAPGSYASNPGGLLHFILLNCLAVGLLAGLAEVCWSYLLPVIKPQWRALLPISPGETAVFVVAAVVTDLILALIGGVVLWLTSRLITRLAHASSGSNRVRVLTRTAALGAALSYLYLGWMGFFILWGPQTRTMAGSLVLIAGVVVALLVSLMVSVGLAAQQRRRKWLTPAKVWCASLAVLLIVWLPAFWRYRASALAQPRPEIAISRGGPRPNVLLVTLDTLRVDYLGCYGHPWIKTPTLDELAVHGAVFDAAIAQSPLTSPSHCSIMTSTYPFDHDTRWNGTPMRTGLITLADVLGAHGYETVAFASATPTRSIDTGLHQGFERYVDSLVPWSTAFSYDGFQRLIFFYLAGIAQHSQLPGEVITDRALDWLASRSDKRPFFAWLHYFDPHDPYGSPPPFQDTYKGWIKDGLPAADKREHYAEDITYADHQLGRFITQLRERGLYDNTLIIATADHGEAFGEQHGVVTEFRHGHYVYDTTQHVPLIIKPPGARLLAYRVAEQVELNDIAPTVLRFLRIEPPESFVGTSLNDLLARRPAPDADRRALSFNVTRYVPTASAARQKLHYQQFGVRTPDWKYITVPRLGHGELYDLRADPAERFDVAAQHPDIVAQRRAYIGPYWDADRDTGEDPRQRLAPGLVRQLQALGYLGGDDSEHEPNAEEDD